MTLEEALNGFVEFLKSGKKAFATVIAYRKDITQLIEYLKRVGRANISEIASEDLNNFLALLSTQKYTPKSVSRKINALKTFYKYLALNKIIPVNIAAGLSHPKVEAKAPRILSRLEYRALRDTCREDARIAAIVELLLQTGIRIGELANLSTDSVAGDFLQIPVIENHPAREIPLNRAAKAALDSYLATRPKGDKTLFITKTGRPLLVRNIRTAIDRYFKLAGITMARVNDLRHTFIAHHLAAGASPALLAKLAGYKRIGTTEKYLEYIKELPAGKQKLEEL